MNRKGRMYHYAETRTAKDGVQTTRNRSGSTVETIPEPYVRYWRDQQE